MATFVIKYRDSGGEGVEGDRIDCRRGFYRVWREGKIVFVGNPAAIVSIVARGQLPSSNWLGFMRPKWRKTATAS